MESDKFLTFQEKTNHQNTIMLKLPTYRYIFNWDEAVQKKKNTTGMKSRQPSFKVNVG